MNAHTTREYTCFTSHCLKNDVGRSVDSLADVLLNSNIKEADIEAERSTILREYEEVNTDLDEVLFDKVHEAAYAQSSLGFPILGSTDNIKSITKDQMLSYREKFYVAPRMVLVGVGEVNHDELVKLGEKYFSELPSEGNPNVWDPTSSANFLGGEVRFQDDNIPLMYSAIGFEGPPIGSAEMVSVNLMQILLGAWDRSMGAGKHVQSHLCNIVADNHYAYSVSSFCHAYSDSSIFGVQAISDGDKLRTESLHLEMISQMTRFCYKITEDELERAKNVLKTQVLSQYEGQLDNVCEELGKQVLFYGRRQSLLEMFGRIDDTTVDHVKSVAEKYIYDKDPITCAVGNSLHLVDYHWLKMFTYQWKQ